MIHLWSWHLQMTRLLHYKGGKQKPAKLPLSVF